MKRLSKEQILMLHSQLIEQTGGIELRYIQKQLFEIVLAVADGTLEYEAMLRWVLEHQE